MFDCEMRQGHRRKRAGPQDIPTDAQHALDGWRRGPVFTNVVSILGSIDGIPLDITTIVFEKEAPGFLSWGGGQGQTC